MTHTASSTATLQITPPPRDRLTRPLGILTLLTLLSALYLGLTAPPDEAQGVLVRLFFIHVPTAWISYLGYFGAGAFGLAYLITRQLKWDRLALASAELGVLFTVSTIVAGMLWAKPTWGAYWVWDARLTTTALSLVIYGGYLLVRTLIDDRERRARVAGVIGLMGTLYIPVNYMAVEWWRGVHQTQTVKLLGDISFAGAPIYGWVLTAGTLAFTLLFLYLLRVRGRLAAYADAREERELLASDGWNADAGASVGRTQHTAGGKA